MHGKTSSRYRQGIVIQWKEIMNYTRSMQSLWLMAQALQKSNSLQCWHRPGKPSSIVKSSSYVEVALIEMASQCDGSTLTSV